MSSNLKYKAQDIIDIPSLKSDLLGEDVYAKISALNQISIDIIEELITEIKLCAYDHRPLVRTFAYKALFNAKPQQVKEVLKDALRDENKAAFQVARELFAVMNKNQ